MSLSYTNIKYNWLMPGMMKAQKYLAAEITLAREERCKLYQELLNNKKGKRSRKVNARGNNRDQKNPIDHDIGNAKKLADLKFRIEFETSMSTDQRYLTVFTALFESLTDFIDGTINDPANFRDCYCKLPSNLERRYVRKRDRVHHPRRDLSRKRSANGSQKGVHQPDPMSQELDAI